MIDPYDIERLKGLHKTALESGAAQIDADLIIDCAETLIGSERFDESLTVLHGALVIEPDHPRAWALSGNVFEKLRREEDARAAYEIALSHDEEDWTTSIALAELYTRNEETSKAMALLVWLLGEVEDGLDVYARAIELKHALEQKRGQA